MENNRIKINKKWLWPLIPGIIGFLVFISGAAYPFYPEWDDGNFVLNNEHLLPSWSNVIYWLTHDMQTLYTPLTMWSLMLDRLLFGLDHTGYHLHNMLLHGIASALLYGIFRQLKFENRWACLAAVLWAVHPQRIESVVWITERKDVLAGVFSFAALLLFMRGYDRKKISFGAIICTLLAMGAKPSSILLPGIMLAYVLYQRQDLKLKKYLRVLWPYFLLAVIFYPVFSYLSAKGGFVPKWDSWPRMPLVPFFNFFWYLITAIAPFELNPIYPRVYLDAKTWIVIAIGIMVIAGALFQTTRKIKGKQWLFDVVPLLICWACLFLPVAGLFRFNNTDYSDRYNYLLSPIIILIVALFIKFLLPEQCRKITPKAFMVLTILVGIGYFAVSMEYIFDWRGSKTLFLRALRTEHPNPKVFVALGEVALNTNDANLMQQAGYGLIQISRKKDFYLVDSQTSANTGAMLMGIGYALKSEYKKSFLFLEHVMTASPNKKIRIYTPKILLPRYWLVLTDCYLQQRNPKAAINCLRHYQAIKWLSPADIYFAKGLQAYLSRDLKGAVTAWSEAARLKPGDTRINYNLQRAKDLLKKKNMPSR